jgi:putative ABC transport system permease protein
MFNQLIAVVSLSIRTLPQRLGASSVIVVGIAAVVAVLVSVLAMSTGFKHTLADAGRKDRVIVLRGGSDNELSSNLSANDFAVIADAPGLAKSADGHAALSGEIVTVVNIPKIDTGTDANVTLRGVSLNVGQVRPELKVIEGRMFRPAVRELIVGIGAAKQFRGLAVGQTVRVRNSEWLVTGRFISNADAHESELMADVDTVRSAIEYSGYSSAIGLLSDAGSFTAFKDALTTNPQLKVEVKDEHAYYAKQSQQLAQVIDILGNVVAAIMALGATFGALNTMYSSVATRAMEIATLRAIGFSALPVLMSVMIESLLLALLGGLLGGGLAWLFFNGHSVSTMGGAFAQVVFTLTVTGPLLVTGIVWACLIGILGGFFPALRAARLPVAEALRAG